LAPVASLVSVHHLRPRAGLVSPIILNFKEILIPLHDVLPIKNLFYFFCILQWNLILIIELSVTSILFCLQRLKKTVLKVGSIAVYKIRTLYPWFYNYSVRNA